MLWRKWCLLLFILLFVLSCNKNNKHANFVHFSGHIANASVDSIYIILQDREKAFALDFDGNFSDTLQINQEGYNTLAIDREEFTIYTTPKDSIVFNVDLKDFDSSYKFSGNGANRNNYLFAKEITLNNWLYDTVNFKLSPVKYKAKLSILLKDLKKQLHQKDFSPKFNKLESKNLVFDSMSLVYAYRDSYAYFNPNKIQLPVDFINFDSFDMDNEKDYEVFKSYRNIVNYYFEESLNRGNLPTYLLSNMKSESIKNVFIGYLLEDLDPNDPTSEMAYQAIKKYCTYQPWLDLADKKMNRLN